MLIGPVFGREVVIAPRRMRFYIARTTCAVGLLLVMSTAWAVLTGTQIVRDVGDLARFGTILFQILARVQLALGLFFSALLAASAVAQEKDRRTLVLLLLTRLSDSELVLGKLLASVLQVLVMLAAALPVFVLSALFGGVSVGQIGWVFAVTLASVLACGSLGSTLALWREKTFQALAMTVLVLVLWLAVWEMVATVASARVFWGIPCRTWASGFSPWRAIIEATRPRLHPDPALGALGTPVHLFLVVAVAISALLNGVAVAMVRVWNPSREARPVHREEDARQPESIWGAEHDTARATGEADTIRHPAFSTQHSAFSIPLRVAQVPTTRVRRTRNPGQPPAPPRKLHCALHVLRTSVHFLDSGSRCDALGYCVEWDCIPACPALSIPAAVATTDPYAVAR